MSDKKKLVAYFSATGVTKGLAEKIAEVADADIFEIKPEVPYSNLDLDWANKEARSTVEMKDKSFRPPIAEKCPGMENYDLVFIGFPIWWFVAPSIINTFLESYDFSGKTVVLFATSRGSRFGKTLKALEGSYSPSAKMIEGKILSSRMTEKDISKWIDGLDI